MAGLNLALVDNGSIDRHIKRVQEIISGLERVKDLISELKSDEIELTVNGTTYVSEVK